MRLVADANIHSATALFGGFGDLRVLPGPEIDHAAAAAAEVLLVRSGTRLDQALLAGTPVRFAATATAGTDHVDRAALDALGITFAHAPAANAPAVVDWVLGVLAADALARQRDPQGLRVAVVGCGAVGGRLLTRLQALGVRCTAVDPPLMAQGTTAVAGVPLQPLAAVAGADVLSLHVPLQDGAHATRGLLDGALLDALAPAALVVNASRGPVADGAALLQALDGPPARRPVLALDVWPEEPRVPPALHARLLVGTPHIAGHSVEAKWQGSLLVRQALARWYREQGLDVPADPGDLRPPAPAPLQAAGAGWRDLWALVANASGVAEDHVRLAAALPDLVAEPLVGFETLRRTYRQRRDFAALTVRVPAALAAAARALGFGQVLEV